MALCPWVAMAQDNGDDGVRQTSVDSLIELFGTTPHSDTAIVRICYGIAREHYSVDSTIMWSERLISLADMHDMPKYKCEAYGFLSWASYYKDQCLTGISINRAGLSLADSLADLPLKAYFQYMMGYDYYKLQDYKQADHYYKEALEIYQQECDTSGTINVMRAMASNFIAHRLYSLAEQWLKKAIELATNSQCWDEKHANCLVELADTYLAQYRENITDNNIRLLDSAKVLARDALDIDCYDYAMKCKGDVVMLKALAYSAFFSDYDRVRIDGIADRMYPFYIEGCRYMELFGEEELNKYDVDLSLANYYICKGELASARRLLDSLQDVSGNRKDRVDELYLSWHAYYRIQGNHGKALEAFQRYSEALLHKNDADFAIVSALWLKENEYEETERRKEKERELSERDRLHFWNIVGVIVFLAIVFMIWALIHNRRHNHILAERNHDLDKKNRNITSSLNYAHLIQEAVLPNDDELRDVFPDYFLIYKPLNIVSGDFYWLSRVGSRNILACADCTGHGVPGAFVSMLGISLLNEITATAPVDVSAADILNELRPRLIKALGQSKAMHEQDTAISMEGMDIALVILDRGNMRLEYAGAYRPLWIMRGGNLIQHKPDRMPIGRFVGPDRDFCNHEIDVEPGDVLYMFSDGITDQMGYIDEARTEIGHFSVKRFADLMNEVGALPLDVQRGKIETAVDAWRNGYRQLDDILMMGVRI